MSNGEELISKSYLSAYNTKSFNVIGSSFTIRMYENPLQIDVPQIDKIYYVYTTELMDKITKDTIKNHPNVIESFSLSPTSQSEEGQTYYQHQIIRLDDIEEGYTELHRYVAIYIETKND